jgi:hypothetical protein
MWTQLGNKLHPCGQYFVNCCYVYKKNYQCSLMLTLQFQPYNKSLIKVAEMSLLNRVTILTKKKIKLFQID